MGLPMDAVSGTTHPDAQDAMDDAPAPARCGCCMRSTWRLTAYLIFFIGYLCLGAACFMWVETPEEERAMIELLKARKYFLNSHTCVSETALNKLVAEVVAANDIGVTMEGNTTSPTNWAFGQSVFFAMTIVTTIGYGRTAPLSELGKGICIIYTLIGIPLAMVMFTAMVERIYIPARKLLEWMQLKMLGKCSGFDIRVIHLTLSGILLSLLFLFLPSGILVYLEREWTYLDAVYYCIISLTTVGLGDFIPGEKSDVKFRSAYKIAITVYLFLGLIAMLFVLRIFQDVPELNIGNKIYTSSDLDIASSESSRLKCKLAAKSYTSEVTNISEDNTKDISSQSSTK